jgi:macrolide-specific efflux system membrane fusion protein
VKKLLWLGLGAVVIFLILVYLFRIRNGDGQDRPSFETARVERQNIEVKVLSTGTIQPYTRVEVTSPVNGRIDRVEVDEGEMVREGDILAWISSEERAALLDAARSELEEAQERGDKETLEEVQRAYTIAERAYRPVLLSNSISGEVIKRSCEPGQNVSTQTVLFVISDRLVAGVEVDEADIGKIKTNQDARILLDAFPDERIEGRVTKVSREGRIVSNVVVYDVMVEPSAVPSYWSSGMTANVEFLTESKNDILAVPKSAVRERDGRNFVMVLAENPDPRPIETGITDGKVIEVARGLTEGETVILGEIEKSPVGNPGSDLRRQMRMMRPPR